MGLLSGLTKAFDNYGDDILRSIGKQMGSKLDDGAVATSLWKSIGNKIDDGISGSQIRDSLKNAAFSAIDAGDDDAARAIMSNMPVAAHSSSHFDDILSDKVGSYFQLTPANNITPPFGDLADNRTFTTLIDPEMAVKQPTDQYTKLISPMDTGFNTGRGKTLQQWSDDLAKEINGIADSTEIGNRNLLRDYVYQKQGKLFDIGGDDISYNELALPRSQAREALQKEFMDVGTGDYTQDALNRGKMISQYALEKVNNSKNRSKAFDQIFLTGAPIVGGGAILASLLANSDGNNNQPI